MKQSRFTQEQVIAILREQEAEARTAELCRGQRCRSRRVSDAHLAEGEKVGIGVNGVVTWRNRRGEIGFTHRRLGGFHTPLRSFAWILGARSNARSAASSRTHAEGEGGRPKRSQDGFSWKRRTHMPLRPRCRNRAGAPESS